jgi:acyl carrier protein
MRPPKCSTRCEPSPGRAVADRTLDAVSDVLIRLFAEGLGVDESTLNEGTSPDNTSEWDSLAAITLVSLIEDEFEVRLGAREIMKMQTIGLARSVLKAKGVSGI